MERIQSVAQNKTFNHVTQIWGDNQYESHDKDMVRPYKHLNFVYYIKQVQQWHP